MTLVFIPCANCVSLCLPILLRTYKVYLKIKSGPQLGALTRRCQILNTARVSMIPTRASVTFRVPFKACYKCHVNIEFSLLNKFVLK